MIGSRDRSDGCSWFARGSVVLAVALAAAYLPLLNRQNINWDEFRFLSDVYAHQRGELTRVLQTVHVHLFGWLIGVSGNEVEQVIAARMGYFLLLVGSCTFLYLIGRRFYSPAAAALTVVCYLSYAEVIRHGTSFRFDGLGTFFILGALALLLRTTSTWGLLLAAILCAIAHLVTIKSVFYLPTFVSIVAVTSWSLGTRLVGARVIGFAAAATIVFFALLALHEIALGDAELTTAAAFAADASERVIRFDVAYLRGLLESVFRNAVIWYVLVLGVLSIVRRIPRSADPREELLVLALLLPLASVLVYRNAFPYFYVFLMGSVLIAAGRFFEDALDAHRRSSTPAAIRYLTVVMTCILVSFGFHYLRHWPDRTTGQRALLATVHRLFPEEVAYIDRNSMVASFPKVGFFMSTWGFETYHRAGQPIFSNLIRRHQPRFLLANHPALAVFETERTNLPAEVSLLPEDVAVLRENYLPYWGTLHLPGKRIELVPGAPRDFEILIEGVYVLRTDSPVVIDGASRSPGEQVELPVGMHTLSFPKDAAGQIVELRLWTREQPHGPPPDQPLYYGL